jgi:hypothetical protein|eukprot:CAMPEP_0169062632 /NCGR_PEP_ID=MMETSP1015-20121227/802_1 /TAXON_ID=342587 /ORGANISM="Karlodinium micrum, Strain CCMP2283" /LENGTH=191 /DNA_ID=CAMNT_0009120809 /DNA_START=186 /DNA_END=761 /DNA_ORIENTATION=+
MASPGNLEDLALAGGVGAALLREKKIRTWNMDGHSETQTVLVQRRASLPDLGIAKQTPRVTPVARSGFHRLVYQKARKSLTEQHDGHYGSFKEMAQDMVHSVKICLKATDIGRDLRRQISGESDTASCQGDSVDESTNGDADSCERDSAVEGDSAIETSGEVVMEGEDVNESWKDLMTDLSPLTPFVTPFA